MLLQVTSMFSMQKAQGDRNKKGASRLIVRCSSVESTAPPALNGVSVTIPAGQKVGVVGRTGG